RVLDQRLAVAALLAGPGQGSQEPLAATGAAAGPVLELQMGAGHGPAVVLAADQVLGRHAHVVEVDGVLDGIANALALIAEKLHGADGDTRQVHRDHEPAEVLVALAVRVGAYQRPGVVDVVGAAHEDLLAVDDILIAV